MGEASRNVAIWSADEFGFCRRNKLEALIFDWDGVLVDSAKNYYEAYYKVLHEVGIEVTPREIYLREGQPTPQLMATLMAERGISANESRIQEMVERRRSYDIASGPRVFFPGVWDLLLELRKSSYKLALVTGSSRKSVELLLDQDRERCFGSVITADDITRAKPDPQPFALAVRELGLPAQQCLVVENAPFGIRSARAAGCRTIGLCSTLAAEDLVGADWIVENHQELFALLRS
jgi:beta-phosphoglucomutase